MSEGVVQVRIGGSEIPEEARIQRLDGTERIHELFDFRLIVAAPASAGLDAAKLLGSEVTLRFERDGVLERAVVGMVSEVDDLAETEATTRRMRLRVMPREFRMTLVATQEVYLDRSVPEIFAEKLGLAGLADALVLRLAKSYPKKEFVTQYKESDLAFVSRLLEHEGLSYFFEYDADEDRACVVLTDHNGGFTTPEHAEVEFHGRGETRGIFELAAEHRLTPAVCVVQDYNYRTALLDLTAQADVEGGFGGGVVEYGSHHKTPEEGSALARIRAEEQRAKQLVYVGKTTHSHVGAGMRLSITGHTGLGDLDVLVTEVRHHVEQIAFGTETETGPYVATFHAIPRDRAYRPERRTPRPRIYGIVNAIIDDARRSDDRYAQIDPDGRYIVKLLYDTADSSGRLASRWVRMAQPHAGPDYGMHFPLKPGAEVLLAFIDGDPDRPIIVGAVPNPITRSPVDAASNTVNRIKSASGILIEYGDRRLSSKS